VIFNKLSWLDRDELIKRFMSIEFNQFLAYYKDARDINVENGRPERQKGGMFKPASGHEAEGRNASIRRSTGERTGQHGGRERKAESRGQRAEGKPYGAGSDERSKRAKERYRQDKSEFRDDRTKPEPAKRGAERPKVKFTSLVINQGTANKFNPKVLLSLINQYMPDQETQVGKIDVQFTHTMFDVDEAHKDQVIQAFRKAKFKGYKLVVDQPKKKKKA
jgi:ATP-dependent RNA helicase DeaD